MSLMIALLFLQHNQNSELRCSANYNLLCFKSSIEEPLRHIKRVNNQDYLQFIFGYHKVHMLYVAKYFIENN